MAYIYEDELKEILPDIMKDWIDKDDESWEYIFQAIEQKCYVGTNKKKGKQWRTYIEDVVDILKSDISDLNDFYHELNKKVDELNNKVGKLNDNFNAMEFRVDSMSRDITAAKSMAQTAKQRTEVDYTKCSKEKSDADVVQEIYNRMGIRGATREELDTFRNLIQKYNALEKKEIPVVKKTCETCKYFEDKPKFDKHPCNACNGNDKWETKKVDCIGLIEEDKEEQSKSCTNCKYYSNKNGVYACTCSNGICGVDNENWEDKDNA